MFVYEVGYVYLHIVSAVTFQVKVVGHKKNFSQETNRINNPGRLRHLLV